MSKIMKSRTEVLREYAERVPNYQSMIVDYNRDSLTVFFDGIHSRQYKASVILDKFCSAAKLKGFEVVWKE